MHLNRVEGRNLSANDHCSLEAIYNHGQAVGFGFSPDYRLSVGHSWEKDFAVVIPLSTNGGPPIPLEASRTELDAQNNLKDIPPSRVHQVVAAWPKPRLVDQQNCDRDRPRAWYPRVEEPLVLEAYRIREDCRVEMLPYTGDVMGTRPPLPLPEEYRLLLVPAELPMPDDVSIFEKVQAVVATPLTTVADVGITITSPVWGPIDLWLSIVSIH